MLTILYTDEMKCMSILFNEAVADPGIVSQNKRCNLIIKYMLYGLNFKHVYQSFLHLTNRKKASTKDQVYNQKEKISPQPR